MERVLRFWWGSDDISGMTKNRKKCYNSIFKNSGIEKIEMISPSNCKQYEVKEHPFHEGFEYLSDVHKGDYLRAYVTYHFGGCWTDVKYIDKNWNKYFNILDKNPDKWGIGFQNMIIENGIYRKLDLDKPGYKCISMAHFIFRKKTPLFFDYINRIEVILDKKLDLLKAHPGHVHPYICVNAEKICKKIPNHLKTYPYPFRWMEISVPFYGVQMQYLDKIMYGMPPAHNFATGHDHR